MHLKRQYLPNGETVAHVTLFGANRDPRVREWHEKVMVDHWGIPVTYIQCPFPGASHGQCMNEVLRNTIHSAEPPTYYWWWDNDAILLRHEGLDAALDAVRNKRTIWGQAWNSSHKFKARGGTHPYASQACLCFSREVYMALGYPDCDHHNPRSDTAEELTYAAEEQGYTVALQWPSKSDGPYTVELGQTSCYGRSITYGPNLTYHETRADLPGHVERFVAKCKNVLSLP